MPVHTVRDGECLMSIATAHGFFWATLWDLPENAALRKRRDSPHILAPGDRVYVPALRERAESVPTDRVHRFRRRGVPAKLRFQVMLTSAPRRHAPFELSVEGVTFRGVTDADGVIEVPVPPGAMRGLLVVGDGDDREEYELQLGGLDPIDTPSGQRARLENLGIPCGDDDAGLRGALRVFQALQGLPKTGEADAPTLSALREAHGG